MPDYLVDVIISRRLQLRIHEANPESAERNSLEKLQKINGFTEARFVQIKKLPAKINPRRLEAQSWEANKKRITYSLEQRRFYNRQKLGAPVLLTIPQPPVETR